MINNAWNISGKAEAYKKHQKGWSSPEKANKKVGEAHQGYQVSRGAKDMVVQKSGMVSSANPLSQTKSHYTNDYAATRNGKSVSTVEKEERSHYMRSG